MAVYQAEPVRGLEVSAARQKVESKSQPLESYVMLTVVPKILAAEIRSVELQRSQQIGAEYLHFSTSMVVLLRANDIPARWAKGFVAGETMGEQDGYRLQQVRAKHAHSWVEVYFDGVGWLPFEPTKGFSNPVHVVYEQQEALSVDEEAALSQQERKPDELLLEEEEAVATGGDLDAATTRGWLSWKTVLAIGLLALSFVLLLRYRHPLLWRLRIMRVGHLAGAKAWEQALGYLLLALSRRFGKRDPHETLREYLAHVDGSPALLAELMSWIELYERQCYGDPGQRDWDDEHYTRWRDLILHFIA